MKASMVTSVSFTTSTSTLSSHRGTARQRASFVHSSSRGCSQVAAAVMMLFTTVKNKRSLLEERPSRVKNSPWNIFFEKNARTNTTETDATNTKVNTNNCLSPLSSVYTCSVCACSVHSDKQMRQPMLLQIVDSSSLKNGCLPKQARCRFATTLTPVFRVGGVWVHPVISSIGTISTLCPRLQLLSRCCRRAVSTVRLAPFGRASTHCCCSL